MWNFKRYFFLYFFLSAFLASFFNSNSLKSQDFWERIYVPDSITVYSIVVDSNNTIFLGAGYDGGGIYKSTDNGENWIFCGLENKAIYSLTISDNGTIYAGLTHSIYKSSNSGDSWELLVETIFIVDNILHITTKSNDTIFAGGWGGIIRSFDGGQEWNKCLYVEGVEEVNGIDIDTQDNIVISTTNFLSDTGGVYISSNWGEDWNKVLEEETSSIDINSQDEIFALTYWYGVNKSSDLGQEWINYYFGVKDLTSIKINADGIIYIGCEKNMDPNGGVYVSYNNGVNWHELNDGLTNEYIDKLYIDNNGFLYAIHYQTIPTGKLFRSVNTTVNINDQFLAENKSFLVFPNPMKNCQPLKIVNTGEKIFIDEINLFDVNGSLVFSDNIKTMIQFNNYVRINLPHLHKGLYFIQIKSHNNNYLLKLLLV